MQILAITSVHEVQRNLNLSNGFVCTDLFVAYFAPLQCSGLSNVVFNRTFISNRKLGMFVAIPNKQLLG